MAGVRRSGFADAFLQLLIGFLILGFQHIHRHDLQIAAGVSRCFSNSSRRAFSISSIKTYPSIHLSVSGCRLISVKEPPLLQAPLPNRSPDKQNCFLTVQEGAG